MNVLNSVLKDPRPEIDLKEECPEILEEILRECRVFGKRLSKFIEVYGGETVHEEEYYVEDLSYKRVFSFKYVMREGKIADFLFAKAFTPV